MDCKLNKVEKKVVEPTAAQLAVPRKDLRLYFLDIIFNSKLGVSFLPQRKLGAFKRGNCSVQILKILQKN